MAAKKRSGLKNKPKVKKSEDSDLIQPLIISLPSISVSGKCCVCEECIEEDSQFLRCDNCGKMMHAECWESDIPD